MGDKPVAYSKEHMDKILATLPNAKTEVVMHCLELARGLSQPQKDILGQALFKRAMEFSDSDFVIRALNSMAEAGFSEALQKEMLGNSIRLCREATIGVALEGLELKQKVQAVGIYVYTLLRHIASDARFPKESRVAGAEAAADIALSAGLLGIVYEIATDIRKPVFVAGAFMEALASLPEDQKIAWKKSTEERIKNPKTSEIYRSSAKDSLAIFNAYDESIKLIMAKRLMNKKNGHGSKNGAKMVGRIY